MKIKINIDKNMVISVVGLLYPPSMVLLSIGLYYEGYKLPALYIILFLILSITCGLIVGLVYGEIREKSIKNEKDQIAEKEDITSSDACEKLDS
ncbi:hypothetical protein BN85409580 [Alteracholeplasma palmae J233]|uniref:Uncharacterized protein n=1 Tax=Alteracholeplasma palmae (strain ATCC 49389 / J233) TaxID=1318466 RepID=U4KQE4_ALTPJ|nr:hypothetical protein [Alteracholeplasma palmae]CCV64535.1 hypothetical protein BN85409580 [Alteracholeplasma palmae J233]